MVKEIYDLDEKPSVDDKFQEQIVVVILINVLYDHIKTEESYAEPTVQDAQTIDEEIKQENKDFLQIAAKINKIDMVATAQKSDFLKDLFDAVIDLPDSIQITEDIFIDDDLFSENDIEGDNKQIIDNIL